MGQASLTGSFIEKQCLRIMTLNELTIPTAISLSLEYKWLNSIKIKVLIRNMGTFANRNE